MLVRLAFSLFKNVNMTSKRILVFGGSFNPLHNGHLSLCEYVMRSKICDEVWLMVSPLNPLKKNERDLANERVRLEMARLALDGKKGVVVRDDEIMTYKDGEPTYTINTLDKLKKTYGDAIRFQLLIGEDNLRLIKKWKSWERIVREYGLVVYPREDISKGEAQNETQNTIDGFGITLLTGVKLWNVSSSQIRSWIAHNEMEKVKKVVPSKVFDYICANGLYGA